MYGLKFQILDTLNDRLITYDTIIDNVATAKLGKNVNVIILNMLNILKTLCLKPVSAYYVGRLKSISEIFDFIQVGLLLKFKLQRGEVIKAWDIGIADMLKAKENGVSFLHCFYYFVIIYIKSISIKYL